MTNEDLENRFNYHPAGVVKGYQHTAVRAACFELAEDLNNWLPEGREKALAITKLEEAMFWANAAIARTPDE